MLPAWQYSSDKAEQEKLNTWRVRLALEDEKGNRQNSGVVEITVQQDRKIELIVNNIADVPDENNHSHEASAQADGVDGVVMISILLIALATTLTATVMSCRRIISTRSCLTPTIKK